MWAQGGEAQVPQLPPPLSPLRNLWIFLFVESLLFGLGAAGSAPDGWWHLCNWGGGIPAGRSEGGALSAFLLQRP